jgi:hypothetical protein
MNTGKKVVKIKENELVNLIDKIVNESVAAEKKKVVSENKTVTKKEPKKVMVKESDLVNMIEKIVNETIKTKKKLNEAKMTMTIADIDNRKDLSLVTDSQDVEAIKDYIGGKAEDFDSFYVKVKDGDYAEVYGFMGSVPYLHKKLHRII